MCLLLGCSARKPLPGLSDIGSGESEDVRRQQPMGQGGGEDEEGDEEGEGEGLPSRGQQPMGQGDGEDEGEGLPRRGQQQGKPSNRPAPPPVPSEFQSRCTCYLERRTTTGTHVGPIIHKPRLSLAFWVEDRRLPLFVMKLRAKMVLAP